MGFATGLMGMAGSAAALALLAVSLAIPGAVSAQGKGAGATPGPTKEGQARLCVNAYNSLLKADSRFVADNRAAIETRRQALSKTFGIAAPAITQDESRIGEFLADFTSAQISDCENQFADMPAFQPRIYAGRGLLMAPAAPTPPAPSPAPPSDLACGSIFWVAGLAWPQEREGWLGYANRAVAQHLAANPKDTMTAAEARVMADGQARARLLQQGGAEPDKFKKELDACAAQFGLKPNAPTPAVGPAAKPAAPSAPAPAKNLAGREDVIYRCYKVANVARAGIEKEGRAPSPTLKLFASILLGDYMGVINNRFAARNREIDAAARSGRAAPPAAPPLNTKAIDAEVDALAAKGNDALGGELRRCWTIFNDRPVPADLI